MQVLLPTALHTHHFYHVVVSYGQEMGLMFGDF